MSTNGYTLSEQLAVEIDASELSNLVANHSAQTGNTTGWAADANVTLSAATNPTRTYSGAPQILQGTYTGGKAVAAAYGSSAAVLAETRSPSFAVVPGKWVGYQISIGDSKTITTSPWFTIDHRICFYNGSGVLIGSSTATRSQFRDLRPNPSANDPWTTRTFGAAAQVPSGAATARIALVMHDSNGSSSFQIQRTVYLTKLMVVSGNTEQDVTAVGFTDSAVWQSILGSATSAKILRGGSVEGVTDDIDEGSITLTVLDASLDPARSTRARRGRRVRVMVNTVAPGSGAPVFEPLFTGRISEITADYASTKGQTSAQYRPRLSIIATDAVTELRGVGAPFNYSGTLEQKVRQIMALTTVPFVTDTPATTGSTAKTSLTEDAQVWDQLALTRNSYPGSKLFVRKDGTLVCNTPSVPAASASFSAASGAALSFLSYRSQMGTRSLVNSLMITRRNSSESGGEKQYGPYLNAASKDSWGTSSAELTVIDGTPSTIATWYLQRFANPAVVVSELTFSATKTLFSAGTPHRLELYQTVSFDDPVAQISGTYFVVGIEHDITPRGWLVTLRLRPADDSYSATVTNGSGASDAGPRDVIGEGVWQNLNLGASFQPYGAPYRVPQYRVQDGRVTLRGLVQTTIARTASVTVATLAGNAPAAQQVFLVVASQTWTSGAASTGTAHTHPLSMNVGRIEITSAGVIQLVASAAAPYGARGFFSLDGISWDFTS